MRSEDGMTSNPGHVDRADGHVPASRHFASYVVILPLQEY